MTEAAMEEESMHSIWYFTESSAMLDDMP